MEAAAAGAAAAVLLAVTVYVFHDSLEQPASTLVKVAGGDYLVDDLRPHVTEAAQKVAKGYSELQLNAGKLFVLPKPAAGRPPRQAGDGQDAGDVVGIVAGKCILLDLGGVRAGAGAAAGDGGEGVPAGTASSPSVGRLSVTEVVGPTFEDEARKVLVSVLPVSASFIGNRSDLVTRLLSLDDSSRQADVFCYFEELSQSACVSAPDYGARVITSGAFVESKPPLGVATDMTFSAFLPSRKGPQKLLLAEAYSGLRDPERVGKIQQLESLVQFSVQRRCDFEMSQVGEQFPGADNKKVRQRQRKAIAAKYLDITCLVGIAMLCFSAGADPRGDQLDGAVALVHEHLPSCPGLLRLAQAGRLVVVMVDRTQTPNTFNQRAVAAELVCLRQEQRQTKQLLTTILEEMRAR